MELREYITVIQKYYKAIIGIAIIVVGAALTLRAMQPQSFTATETLTVSRVNVQNTSVYKFDDYYALQASDIFTKTIAGWLQTPAFVSNIFQDAKITAPSDLDVLGRFVTTNKLSAQVLQIKVSAGSVSEAEKLSKSLVGVVKQETAKQNELTKATATFNIEATEPLVVANSKKYPLVAVAGGAVGVFAGYLLALFLNYMSKTKKA